MPILTAATESQPPGRGPQAQVAFSLHCHLQLCGPDRLPPFLRKWGGGGHVSGPISKRTLVRPFSTPLRNQGLSSH